MRHGISGRDRNWLTVHSNSAIRFDATKAVRRFDARVTSSSLKWLWPSVLADRARPYGSETYSAQIAFLSAKLNCTIFASNAQETILARFPLLLRPASCCLA